MSHCLDVLSMASTVVANLYLIIGRFDRCEFVMPEAWLMWVDGRAGGEDGRASQNRAESDFGL